MLAVVNLVDLTRDMGLKLSVVVVQVWQRALRPWCSFPIFSCRFASARASLGLLIGDVQSILSQPMDISFICPAIHVFT